MDPRFAGTVYEQTPHERARLRRIGSFFRWCGPILFALGIAGSVVYIDLISQLAPGWAKLLGLPAGIGLGAWMACYTRSKHYLALSAQEILAKDLRPPVIYLRSFEDDKRRHVRTFKQAFPIWRIFHPIKAMASELALLDPRTEEEILAAALTPVGPVIGIGRPGEKLPQLGAARVYVSDDGWQQTVHNLLSGAALAVLRLGKTSGFYWEVERSAHAMEPTRLVVLIPFWRREYEEFSKRASSHFPKGLPPYNCSIFHRLFGANLLGALKGMIYFQADWTPVFVDLARINWPWKYKLRMAGRRDLINAYEWALQPVYRQLNIEWKPPKFKVSGIPMIAFKSLGVLLAILLIAILCAVAWSMLRRL